MDQLLRSAWFPIFRLYDKTPEPDWERFRTRFGPHIVHTPMVLHDLTADDLLKTLKTQSVRTACGMDGWRVAELKSLPIPLLTRMADMMNYIETQGRWPSALERALVSLIPKGEGGEPLNMRPITVASAVYRLWAATRLRDAVQWQEGWAHPSQQGFRPHRGTLDVYWALALRVEETLQAGTPLTGIMLDYSKCFDRLPHDIMLRLGSAMGADDRIMAPLRCIYKSMRRRFKVGGGVVLARSSRPPTASYRAALSASSSSTSLSLCGLAQFPQRRRLNPARTRTTRVSSAPTPPSPKLAPSPKNSADSPVRNSTSPRARYSV